MAARYWVGGSGVWAPAFTANWSATSGGAGGATVPATTDDVIFDGNSGSGSYTVSAYRSLTSTITIASPAVVTVANSAPATNDPVVFSTTGALPTGLTPGVTYYAINVSTTTFRVSLTPGGAAINTSGTQSGTHTVAGLTTAGATNPVIPLSITINNTTSATSLGTLDVTQYVTMGVQASATLTRFTQSSTQGTFAVSGSGIITLNCGVNISNPSIFSFTVATLYNNGLLSQWNFNNCSMSSNIIIFTNGLTLTGNLTTTGSFTHTNNGAGPITITGYTLSVGSAVIGGSALAATYNFGSTGVFNVTGTSGTVLQVNSAYTPTGTNAFLNLTGGGSTARAITMGTGASASINVTNGTYSLTQNTAGGLFDSLDFTGFSGTWVGDATACSIAGTLTLSPTMTMGTGTGAVSFVPPTATTKTHQLNGLTFNRPMTINGPDTTAVTTFNTSVAATSVAGALTISGGALDITNKTFTAYTLAYTTATAKLIAFGTSGKIYLTAPVASSTIFSGGGSTVTSVTYTGTSNVTVNSADASQKSFITTSFNPALMPDFYFTGGTYVLSTGTSVFGNVDFTGSSVQIGIAGGSPDFYGNVTLGATASFTAGTGAVSFLGSSRTITFTGNSIALDRPILVSGTGLTVVLGSDIVGNTRSLTITEGTLNLNDYQFSVATFVSAGTLTRGISFGTTGALNITGSGVAVWSVTCTYVGADVITLSGTSNITFTSTAGTQTTITSSTATTALAQTNAFNFNIVNSTRNIILTGVCKNLDFTGYGGPLDVSSTPTIYGDLTIPTGSSMTIAAGTNPFTFKSSSTQNITLSKTFDRPITMSGTGTVTLLQALTMGSTATSIFTHTSGTLDLGAQTLTTLGFTTTGTTTRAINFNGGTIVASGSTATAWNASGTNLTMTSNGTISMTGAAAKTFVAGCFTYPIVSQDGAGVLTFTGASYYSRLTNTNNATVVPTAILYTPLTAAITSAPVASPGVFTVASGSVPPTGTPVVFTAATFPGGITGSPTIYYVYKISNTTFSVSTTMAGALTVPTPTGLVNITSLGSSVVANYGNAFNTFAINGRSGTSYTGTGSSSGATLTLTATTTLLRPGSFITGTFGSRRVVSGSGTTYTITPTTPNIAASSAITASNDFTLASTTNATKHYLAAPTGIISTVQYVGIIDSQAWGDALWYASTESNTYGNNTGWNFTAGSLNMAIFIP